ncbi:hypothetical protein TNCV_4981901 [Trichonephila clavipes]|nr:hypothetical protein TNCV_4981901 [Trichonephila clavipes]
MTDSIPDKTTVYCRQSDENSAANDTNLLTDVKPTVLRHGRLVKEPSLVYADKPQTLDHLEGNIRRVIADIRPQTLKKVIENWTSRLDYIRASHGSHMSEIIFKM